MGIWISTRTAILRTKKELPVLEYIDRLYGYIQTRIRADTPMNETTAVPIRLRNKPDNDCAVTPIA